MQTSFCPVNMIKTINSNFRMALVALETCPKSRQQTQCDDYSEAYSDTTMTWFKSKFYCLSVSYTFYCSLFTGNCGTGNNITGTCV